MALQPRFEDITGNDLTGNSGDASRTYTLVNSVVQSSTVSIIKNGTALMQDTDFTVSGQVVTFVVNVFDEDIIVIYYWVEATTNIEVTVGGYKRVLYDNPAVSTPATTTTAALAYGGTTVTVSSSTGFAANDFILIEEQGHELNEIRKISSVDSATQITLTGGVIYPHTTGADITKLTYDQYRITRSDDNLTYSTIVTDDIDYTNEHNQIDYLDTSAGASDSKYYKVYYYNSHSGTLALQATLYNQDNFSYCPVSIFASEIGVLDTNNENFVAQALVSGVEYIRSNTMTTRILEAAPQDTVFNLDLGGKHVADWNGDREVNKYDVTVYEYDPQADVRIFIAHKIVAVLPKINKIIFSEEVPSSGRTLVINVPTASRSFSENMQTYSQINKLLAANYLLDNTTNDAVKSSVLSWTAGGTTVSRDPTTVATMIEKNNQRISSLINSMLNKTYFQSSKLRTTVSSLNTRVSNGYGFRTPGGNTW